MKILYRNAFQVKTQLMRDAIDRKEGLILTFAQLHTLDTKHIESVEKLSNLHYLTKENFLLIELIDAHTKDALVNTNQIFAKWSFIFDTYANDSKKQLTEINKQLTLNL
jgi:hypothetical protein